jgi:hypothetical protein
MSAGLAVGLTPAGVARAAETSDVQDLRREVKQLKAEVNALQVVLAETTELERQRSANLTRAVKATEPSAAAAPSAEADAPLAPTAAAASAPATPPAAREGKAHGSSHKRHNKRSPRSRSRDR